MKLFVWLDQQHGHLINWGPVCIALGISIYFYLPFEPKLQDYVIAGIIIFGLLIFASYGQQIFQPIVVGFILLLSGFIVAGLRAHTVKSIVLEKPYYGAIQGRIINIDRSASNKIRLTLDMVHLDQYGVTPPRKVRISIQNSGIRFTPLPGMRIILTGYLSPPQGPVEPRGFDFRRNAWFKSLGAIGYSRAPILVLTPPKTELDLVIFKIRKQVFDFVTRQLPKESGAFAGAIMTGDRSKIDQATIQNLRKSNLAHLLAISGLHMGLLAGFVFSSARFLFAMVPWFALRYPTKKIAAVISLIAASFYLILSGASIATERAFIMVAVMLVAILVDRRAFSLRSVALAATLILLYRPESLIGPGFQMSFAATTALIATYGWINKQTIYKIPKPLRMILTVAITSAVAGAATAPIAAAHFNQVANYGLLANILTVPIMGLIVVPFSVAAAILAPFGLSWIALTITGWGISWILLVADWIANTEGAVTYIVFPNPSVLPLIAFGGIWFILWHGKARFWGVAPVILGFFLWTQTQRPALLLSANGGVSGLLTQNGRVMNKKRGDGFTVRAWLENDGDGGSDQYASFLRKGYSGERYARVFQIGGARFMHFIGTKIPKNLEAQCETNDYIIVQSAVKLAGPCILIDQTYLQQTGAIAMYNDGNKLVIETTSNNTGKRLWSDPD